MLPLARSAAISRFEIVIKVHGNLLSSSIPYVDMTNHITQMHLYSCYIFSISELISLVVCLVDTPGGTRDDKMVLIGSHYDTVKTSPGVNDNGSGMTALLQVLKLFTNPGNNIILVIFVFCFVRDQGP